MSQLEDFVWAKDEVSGVWIAEASSLGPSDEAPCPVCSKVVTLRDLVPAFGLPEEGRREILGWKGEHECGALLEVFND